MVTTKAQKSDVLSQISDLFADVSAIEQEAKALLEKRQQMLQEISELAQQAASVNLLETSDSEAPVKKAAIAAGKKALPAKKKATATAGTAKRGRKKADGGMTLKEAISSVMSGAPKEGYKVGEIRDLISDKGLWSSNSENSSSQIQQALYHMVKDGFLVRDAESHRYTNAK